MISTKDVDLKTKGVRFNNLSGWPQEFIDKYKHQRTPTDEELVKELKRIVFTCVELNINAMLYSRMRLFSFNSRTSKNTAYYKIKNTGLVERLAKHYMASDEDVAEVASHRFLDLWHDPNPHHDCCDFLRYYQMFQEVIGATYIKFVPNKNKQIQEWWILPSQLVKVLKTVDGVVYGFRYQGKSFSNVPSQTEPWVLPFVGTANMSDPYGATGYPPLRAAFEHINIDDKLLSVQNAILDNQGIPSLVFTPQEPLNKHDVQREEVRAKARLTRGESGGIYFNNDKYDIDPVTYQPGDISALGDRATEAQIARAFGVPAAMVESKQFNRATLEASILLHVRNAIIPRLRDLETKVNKFILPHFGENLFVAFDDPSPQNEKMVADVLKILVGGPVMTQNEGRYRLDLPAKGGGDSLMSIPGSEKLDQMGDESPSESTEVQPTEDTTEVKPTEADVTPDIETEDQQVSELLGRVGGITGMIGLIQQRNEGVITDDTLIEMLVLFYRISREDSQRIISTLPDVDDVDDTPEPSPVPPVEQDEPEDETEDEETSKIIMVGERRSTKERLEEFHATLPVELKAQTDNRWREVPTNKDLEDVTKQFFRKYRQSALRQAERDYKKGFVRKAFVPLDVARDELSERSRPFIQLMVDEGAKELLGRVGFDSDIFDVTNPNVQTAIDKFAFEFAESTNEATSLQLNEAIETLRQTLSDDLDSGERLRTITQKVNDIFDGLEKHRAFLIAQTESSRAHHEGLRMAAKESGVVTGFELLLSPDACPVCQEVKKNKPQIGLDDYFIEGAGTYGNRFVPIHPNCRCAVIEVLGDN